MEYVSRVKVTSRSLKDIPASCFCAKLPEPHVILMECEYSETLLTSNKIKTTLNIMNILFTPACKSVFSVSSRTWSILTPFLYILGSIFYAVSCLMFVACDTHWWTYKGILFCMRYLGLNWSIDDDVKLNIMDNSHQMHKVKVTGDAFSPVWPQEGQTCKIIA